MTEQLHFHFSLFTFMHWRRKWQPTPVFLPGESRGRGEPGGLLLWGCTESDMTDVTWQQGAAVIKICFSLFPVSRHGISVVHHSLHLRPFYLKATQALVPKLRLILPSSSYSVAFQTQYP